MVGHDSPASDSHVVTNQAQGPSDGSNKTQCSWQTISTPLPQRVFHGTHPSPVSLWNFQFFFHCPLFHNIAVTDDFVKVTVQWYSFNLKVQFKGELVCGAKGQSPHLPPHQRPPSSSSNNNVVVTSGVAGQCVMISIEIYHFHYHFLSLFFITTDY